ncbi:MAG: hypothetical protein FD146_1704 [Anaerolineaceae bacterium]|nr:MAG: hypothetical protein FD146_1704 [Anaerolineaceae bacterium]
MSEKIDHLTKPELLQRIRDERRALEKVLARLTHPQMLLPGVDGEWSVKDVLAHISAWERNMLRWTGSLLRGQPPATPDPWDVERINAAIHAQVKDRPLAEALEEFRESYRAALALAESLTEKQLQTEYPSTWPMGPLWLGVAANMNFHYKEHREDIEKWLEKNRQKK